MKYLDVTVIGLKEAMIYRTEFFAGLVAALINLTVLWFAWNAVYAASASAVIGGFTLSAMMTYLVVSSCLKPINYSNIEYDFEWDVKTGGISTILTKPVSYPLFRIFKGFSITIFNIITNLLPVFLISVLLIGISSPVNPLAFLVSVILGYFVNYLMAFLAGMWAFYSTGSVWGIKLSRQVISDMMSGAVIPLSLFPVWFVSIANLLPFQTMFNLPLSIYLGKIVGIDILYSFAQQIVWLVILGVLCYLVWKRVERKVVVHGG